MKIAVPQMLEKNVSPVPRWKAGSQKNSIISSPANLAGTSDGAAH